MQIPGDLQPLVSALLSHGIRQRLQDLLPLLEFLVGLLERLRSEEHLPREDQGRHDKGQDPPIHALEEHGQGETEDSEA
jgi:hypothetical protein